MPRRTSTRVTSSATPQATAVTFQLPASITDPNVLQLRRHWKWAAFSQFFFTFNALFAMNGVSLIDIENDLAYSTNRVLARIMTRLLVTLTQDRKISIDNWQTALRKQYARRDPSANPIGPIQQTYANVAESSRASTAPPLSSEVVEEEIREDDRRTMKHEDGASESLPPANSDIVKEDPADTAEGKSGEFKADQMENIISSSAEPLQASEQPQRMDWLDLPTIKKLDSLHILVEWQFQNPNRLRTQMKDDDEDAHWRIEPIGYDAKRNAYWLIGADRLWIQRQPSRPTLKRKRPVNSNSSKYASQKSPNKRQRVAPEPESTLPPATPTRSSRLRNQAHAQNSSLSRGTRAAKLRANQMLDAQAKDLAEYQRQVAWSKPVNARLLIPRRPSGIRVSARLHGTSTNNDEWQEVPKEWLSGAQQPGEEGALPMTRVRLKTGLESDEESISDLTELSENDDKSEGNTQEGGNADENEEASIEEVKVESILVPDKTDKELGVNEGDEDLPPREDFIEWETVCVTLEEWENFPEQFEHATHYAEKSLYKALTHNIVPAITAELREVEKKKAKEEAVVHRKRSSRIALKESEKEQELLIAKRRAEDDERMSKARRAEARRQKEDAERIKRENAREQRRKEREAKLAEANTSTDAPIDVMSQEYLPSFIPPSQREKPSTLTASVPTNVAGICSSGSRTPAEDWELDCEICDRRGTNQDDGVPIMCCGKCSKWQHIPCHDRHDAAAGLPKRDWDAEDFICQRCRMSGSRGPSFNSSQPPTPTNLKTLHSPVGSQPYYSNQSSYSHDHYPNGSYYGAPSGRYSYEHQSDIRSSGASQVSQRYSQAPRASGVTFAHYQPQQGGFSTSRPSYAVQDSSLISQQTPYPTSPPPVSGVNQSRRSLETHLSHVQLLPQDRWQPSRYSRSDASCAINTAPSPSLYTSHQQQAYPSAPTGTSPLFSQMQSMAQYSGYQHTPYQQHR